MTSELLSALSALAAVVLVEGGKALVGLVRAGADAARAPMASMRDTALPVAPVFTQADMERARKEAAEEAAAGALFEKRLSDVEEDGQKLKNAVGAHDRLLNRIAGKLGIEVKETTDVRPTGT